jgi:DNA-binding ferritin-like protein
VIHAQPDVAEMARTRSLGLLNQHLAAALVLQDRMLQSPRHLRGDDFIVVDELCHSFAHLMEDCATEIAKRLTDLGGSQMWPVSAGQYRPAYMSDMPDPIKAADCPITDAEQLEDFAQSVLDAAVLAEAYGDGRTADLLARLWREVDCHLWMNVNMTPLSLQSSVSDLVQVGTPFNNLG